MKYRVVVAEITTKTVTVEAYSQTEALVAVADMYSNDEIDMSKDICYIEAEFRIDNLLKEE